MSETKGKPRENTRTAPGESNSATKQSQDLRARGGWRQRKKKASKLTMLWLLLSLSHSKATPEPGELARREATSTTAVGCGSWGPRDVFRRLAARGINGFDNGRGQARLRAEADESLANEC